MTDPATRVVALEATKRRRGFVLVDEKTRVPLSVLVGAVVLSCGALWAIAGELSTLRERVTAIETKFELLLPKHAER